MKIFVSLLILLTGVSVSATDLSKFSNACEINPDICTGDHPGGWERPSPFPDPEPVPRKGTYECYVRSASGKLYGPGPERANRGAAQSIALDKCRRMTGSKCQVAYCNSL